ncbi:MAG: CehA/McbA family metallohydrolase [Candidatus Sericytochromatia bacterium]|nr:CehA/McbA family metallohydrolase [Candidatus Sericytochromatia bacterium]
MRPTLSPRTRARRFLLAMLVAGCGGGAPSDQPRSLAPHAHVDGPMDMAARSMMDGQADVPASLRPAPADAHPGQWLLMSHHNHSGYLDGRKALTTMMQAARNAGLDAMSLTDHNTMKGTLSQEFQNPGDLVMVRGMEWGALREQGETVLGHACLLGLEGDQPIETHFSLDQMLTEATERKATIVINHPFTNNNQWLQPDPDPRAHAVEVWNHWWALVSPIIHNNEALAWWNKALARGQRLTAFGGTDNHGHFYDDIDKPTNMVLAEQREPAALQAAIRRGHVSVLASARAARPVLEVDADGDGRYEVLQGEDLVLSGRLARLKVRIRVQGGKGLTALLISKRGVLTRRRLDQANAEVLIDVAARAADEGFLRVELRKHPDRWWSMTALTNPVYLR